MNYVFHYATLLALAAGVAAWIVGIISFSAIKHFSDDYVRSAWFEDGSQIKEGDRFNIRIGDSRSSARSALLLEGLEEDIEYRNHRLFWKYEYEENEETELWSDRRRWRTGNISISYVDDKVFSIAWYYLIFK